jgi:hypothetical protein
MHGVLRGGWLFDSADDAAGSGAIQAPPGHTDSLQSTKANAALARRVAVFPSSLDFSPAALFCVFLVYYCACWYTIRKSYAIAKHNRQQIVIYL